MNYEPNSMGGPVESPEAKEPPLKIQGGVDRYDHRAGNDDYTQPGDLFRLMSEDERRRLVGNIVRAMTSVPQEIQERQVRHFLEADPAYGRRVAQGLELPSSVLEG